MQIQETTRTAVLNLERFSALVGLSPARVRRLIAEGKVPGAMAVGEKYLIDMLVFCSAQERTPWLFTLKDA